MLINAPILSIYDPKHKTELHCDASSIWFGAILMQREDDNKMHPIFFFSKQTLDYESRYHSFELETLAIIYALRRFKIYFQGKKFKIITDCNALSLTLNKREISPRIARWALELEINWQIASSYFPTLLSHSLYQFLGINLLSRGLIIDH